MSAMLVKNASLELDLHYLRFASFHASSTVGEPFLNIGQLNLLPCIAVGSPVQVLPDLSVFRLLQKKEATASL